MTESLALSAGKILVRIPEAKLLHATKTFSVTATQLPSDRRNLWQDDCKLEGRDKR